MGCLNQVKVLIERYHSGLFFNYLGTVPRLKQGYYQKNLSRRLWETGP